MKFCEILAAKKFLIWDIHLKKRRYAAITRHPYLVENFPNFKVFEFLGSFQTFPMLTMGEARSPIRPHFHNILKYPYRNESNQLGDIVRI